jgi:hypothetical protein
MIRGRDLLKVVDVLNQVETEATLRTQVGRLYYAVFLEVRSWCETNLGYSRVRMAREHQALANLLSSIDSDLVDQMGVLRTSRNAADYDEYLSMGEVAELRAIASELATAILERLSTRER